jgi:hypothetical protein
LRTSDQHLLSSLIFRLSAFFFFFALSFSNQPWVEAGRGRGWPRRANGKRKRAPSPPSEDFGDSEYSEEASFESDRSPALASPPASSEDSDDSMGLSTAARTYWRSIERAGLGGLDESGVSLDEADSSDSSEEWSGGDGDDKGDGSSGGDNDKGDGGKRGGDGGNSNDSGKGDGGGGSGDGSKGDGGGGSDDGGKGDGGSGDSSGKGDGSSGKTSGIVPLV